MFFKKIDKWLRGTVDEDKVEVEERRKGVVRRVCADRRRESRFGAHGMTDRRHRRERRKSSLLHRDLHQT